MRSGLPQPYGDRGGRKTPRSPDTGEITGGLTEEGMLWPLKCSPQSALVTLPFHAAQGWRGQLQSAQHHEHPTSLPATMGVEHVTAPKNGSLSSSPPWEMQQTMPGLGVTFGIRVWLCVTGTDPTRMGLWHSTGSCAAASVSPLCSKLLPFAGSPAQGDASASSNRNVRGVCIPPWFKHSPMGFLPRGDFHPAELLSALLLAKLPAPACAKSPLCIQQAQELQSKPCGSILPAPGHGSRLR